MRYKFFFLFIFLCACIAPSTHAQVSSVPDPVEYTVAPEAPGPNQLVYIEALGVGSFLGNATITWQQNGKVVKSGAGATTFSFTTGGVGSVTTIRATVNSPTNGTMTREFTFVPSIVYLNWEADTSAPLFYKGKSLYTGGSNLKIVALPVVAIGKTVISSSNLSFQWSRNGTPLPAQSGLGKNVLQFDGDQIKDSESVKVEVLYKNAKVGQAEITVPAVDPQILIYPRDPLRGALLERALPASFNLTTSEITLQAEPYYFAASAVRQNRLSYSWTLNDTETVGPDSAKGILTLRQTGQGSGGAVVSVSAQNLSEDNLLQQARQVIQIVFGQAASGVSSFLGL